MIYYFSVTQFNKIWDDSDNEYYRSDMELSNDPEMRLYRKIIFESMHANIRYYESITHNSKSYFGRLTGKPKDINWFLLQL